MPCCGDREKGSISQEEKWDYVNLDDFKSESCLTPFSYFWLWFFLVISLAVYGVDTFTAVNLLAFSRWAGQIKPTIPFSVSRWIYAVCIIISFALLIYRWMRAIRAIRSRSIARSYLDSLAVRIQSIRPGSKGRGWKRFLVFAELTKSKKGAEYVALFTYFSFESWMNTIFADGPRQVVNAITLYSVMQMDLLPGGENAEKASDKSAGVQFFENIKVLAVNNNLRAVVLVGMLFTLVVWVLSVIKLLIAIVLYLIFLFHHIPSRDGTLTTYCRRKINNRVMRIVKQKVNKALAKGVVLQDRQPTQPNLGSDMRPTLPILGTKEEKEPIVTTISRSTTQTTLGNNPTLPDLSWSDDDHPLGRTATETSAIPDAVTGYSPLDRQGSPAPPVPPLPTNYAPAVGLNTPMSRSPMNQSRFNPTPTGTTRSTPGQGYRDVAEHSEYNAYARRNPPAGVPFRSATAAPELNTLARTFSPAVGTTAQPPQSAYPGTSYNPVNRTVSPAPVSYPERTLTTMNYNSAGVNAMGSVPARVVSPVPRNGTPQAQNTHNYLTFDPSMNAQDPIQRTNSTAYPPYSGYTTSPLNDYRRVPSPGPMHSSQTQTPVQGPMSPYRTGPYF